MAPSFGPRECHALTPLVLASVDAAIEPFFSSLVDAYGYIDSKVTFESTYYQNPGSALASTRDMAFLLGPTESGAWQIPVGAYAIQVLANVDPSKELEYKDLFDVNQMVTYTWLVSELATLYGTGSSSVDPYAAGWIFVVCNYTDASAERASMTGTFASALANADPSGFGAAYNASGRLLMATLVGVLGNNSSCRLVAVNPSNPRPLVEVANAINSSIVYGAGSLLSSLYTNLTALTISPGQGIIICTSDSVSNALTYYAPQGNPTTNDGLVLDVSNANNYDSWPMLGLIYTSFDVLSVPSSSATSSIFLPGRRPTPRQWRLPTAPLCGLSHQQWCSGSSNRSATCDAATQRC